jgi:predicted secreted protein
MSDERVELGVMRLTIFNGGDCEHRAANIAQSMCSQAYEMLERALQSLGADMTVAQLDVPPVQVSMDAMDDETIARAGAEAIRRAVIAAIQP